MDTTSHKQAEGLIISSLDLQSPAIIEVDPLILEFPEFDQNLRNREVFVGRIDEPNAPIYNKDSLLHALNRICNFPDYFGFNWDALVDCLWDFSWNPARGYILIYNHPENLDQSDLRVFMDIIRDTSTHWMHNNVPFKLLIAKR
ncbi:MAG: barstar family protein [Roseiflexaceae bacterium]